MPENDNPPKNKKTVRNIIYSFLAFYVSSFVFLAVLDRSFFAHPSFNPKVKTGDFLAIGLSIAVGIMFHRWLIGRSK
jgi:hypothetical protein